jgi:hypothetical protein
VTRTDELLTAPPQQLAASDSSDAASLTGRAVGLFTCGYRTRVATA